MDIKRVSSALLGFPLVVIMLIVGNKYVVDIFLALIALIAMQEYFNAVSKKCNPVSTDCEDAISQICVILGDIDGALEAQRQMLQIMEEDWTTEGESVDSILREIRRLEFLKEVPGRN